MGLLIMTDIEFGKMISFLKTNLKVLHFYYHPLTPKILPNGCTWQIEEGYSNSNDYVANLPKFFFVNTT